MMVDQKEQAISGFFVVIVVFRYFHFMILSALFLNKVLVHHLHIRSYLTFPSLYLFLFFF